MGGKQEADREADNEEMGPYGAQTMERQEADGAQTMGRQGQMEGQSTLTVVIQMDSQRRLTVVDDPVLQQSLAQVNAFLQVVRLPDFHQPGDKLAGGRWY